MSGKFVSYLRVSTTKQGQSGLGLEAQREAVRKYLDANKGTLIEEVIEVESGRRSDRPQLARALARCKMTGATLVVAKLDRLARNAGFLMSVHDGAGQGGVAFCDLPSIPPGPVGTFLVQQMASVAQLEAGLISERTKAALAAAKARGKQLGGWRSGPKPNAAIGRRAQQAQADAFAAPLLPLVRELRDAGMSLRAVAAELTERGVRTRRGGAWTAAAVNAVLARG